MPKSSKTSRRLANQSSRTAPAFQLERLSAWRATRAGWSCGTMPTDGLSEVGARTRTIPPALRRALHLATADAASRVWRTFRQGHHIHHWAQGGPTTLSNLVLLCRRHHRAVHEEGFQVDRGRPASCGSGGRMANRFTTSRRRPRCRGSRERLSRAARGAGATSGCAQSEAGVVRRAARCRLRDRRLASLGVWTLTRACRR